MQEEFQKLDTTVVQVRSVLNFMYTLGYVLDDTIDNGRFVTNVRSAKGNKYLSANTAVKLHNSKDSDWEVVNGVGAFHKEIEFQSGFSPLGLALAKASKLVDQAKFRVTRTGQLVKQSVMIKPLNAAVLTMLGE